MFTTADLCDQFDDRIVVVAPLFRHFGGRRRFHGRIATIKCHEDNQLVREAVSEPGTGRVLVIDGGGSLRSALCGDLLAQKALASGWAGLVINGCVRDSAAIARLELGVLALVANPRRSSKRREGIRDVPVSFAEARFDPGMWIYADEDGAVLSREDLLASS